MTWVWRGLGAVLVLALVLGVAAAGFAGWSLRRPWPQVSGTIAVAGLGSPVEVVRDQRGVADIYADTPEDLFFAHGYVHAQDRFWEMDVRRHITSGRLAEMFGEELVDTDAFVRTLGWRRVAEREFALLSPVSQDVLTSYAEGVNAYLAGRSSATIGFEYQILALQNPRYTIETWNPIDSLAWLKALAWELRGNMDAEIQRALGAADVGEDRIEQLFPPYPQGRNGTIVSNEALAAAGLPTGGETQSAGAAASLPAAAQAQFQRAGEQAALLRPFLGPAGEGIGSNSWVISGEFTATGEPLLANDPHLAPSLPSLWYQVGLHCRTVSDECPYDVSGWTMAGMPGVVIGHNQQIAWGLTNLGPDVMDLTLEKVEGDAYIVDGQAVPIESRTETINVARGEPRTITIRSTRHGPIISDTEEGDDAAATGALAPVPAPGQTQPDDVPERGDGYAVALRWTALRVTPTFDAIPLMNVARNWSDFRGAARLFDVPSQNLVYADADGNIGYQAPGAIPVRTGYDGKWPVPGWDSSYDWEQFIPFNQMPRSLNPPEGVITAANQRVAPAGYPWQLQTDEYSYGARALRIDERLDEAIQAGSVNAALMAEIQLDAGNDLAAFLAPRLSDVPGLSEGAARTVAELGDWDFQQSAASSRGAYFNVFYSHLVDRLFVDELAQTELLDGAGDRIWEAIRLLWETPTDPWWDDVRTEGVEERDQMVAAALNAAYDDLVQRQGDDLNAWRWGDLHTLTFTHQTLGESGNFFLERMFNRGPEPTGGGSGIPLATGWQPTEGYEVTAVPSMRQVVDLADLDASTWVNLTGNSGHTYHDNYGDQIQSWLNGEQYPWAFTRAAVDAAARERLTLEPQSSGAADQ